MTSYFGASPSTVAAVMSALVGIVLLVLGGLALKNGVLLRMSLRNIPRRPAQSVLILFGLMLASLIITASFAVGDTLSYSLKQIQLKQIGGIDEAVVRSQPHNAQGAGFTDRDYFTAQQASDVLAQVTADPGVQAAQGVVISDGSISAPVSGQAAASNVVFFGVAPAFTDIWGALSNRVGAPLRVGDLGAHEVFIGDATATKLDAHPGSAIRLIVNGQSSAFTVRDILATEVNPSVAQHGPTTSSVLVPIATLRSIVARPDGFNAIFIRNRGGGGLDDLGASGVLGRDIARRLRGSFTDSAAAADFKTYLSQPRVIRELKALAASASFLDPTKPATEALLAELARPRVSYEFDSLVQDADIRQVIETAVSNSMPKSATEQQVLTEQARFRALAGALNVSTPAAVAAKAILTRPDVTAALAAASSSGRNPASFSLTTLLAEASKPGVTPQFKGILAGSGVQDALTTLVATAAPSHSVELASALSGLNLYQLAPYKQDAVTFAEQAGLGALAVLLGVSFFSLTVGVLLIFLIFVMLAAERRAEMGMSRAVGLKRRHLTQMFLFEGFGYTIGAALTGVALGVGTGLLMIQVISGIFAGFYQGLALQYHVEMTSVVVAFCLGILLTFVVVSVSAYRVSRLNIVAAIRDIDESGKRDEGLAQYAAGIGRTLASGFRVLLLGHPLTFLRRTTLGVLGAARSLVWALFRRGPLTLLSGLLLLEIGLGGHSALVYQLGIGIACIGAGLLVRWLLALVRLRAEVSSRVGFSLAAAALVLYFGQPFGRVEKLLHVDRTDSIVALTGGPELFIAGSLLLLLGTIWLVMYNSDVLVGVAVFLTRNLGSAGAAMRTGMSYPMATKFRTGMAVAMFATVTFILAYMSVFEDVLNQNLGQATSRAGGWQVVAGTPDQNSRQPGTALLPSDMAKRVAADPSLAGEVATTGWEQASLNASLRRVVAGQVVAPPGRQGEGYHAQLHVVDDGYLSATTYALHPRAVGYSTDRAVWDRVRSADNYAVIDASVLQPGSNASALVPGIDPKANSFQPFQLDLGIPGAEKGGGEAARWVVTVIGFTNQPLWDGVYVSTSSALASPSGFVAPSPTAPGAIPAPKAGGGGGIPMTPTGYYFALRPGASATRTRLDLGRMLVNYQVEPVIVADQLAQQTSGNITLFNLISGFLALGLIVGIAGLGVISTRAVVERRQQIGMLRSLGFRRSLVQASFLLESSFIALLGLVIGTILGIWQSYRFIVVDKSFGAVDFHVPVVQLGLILAGAYAATLLTTWLPARSASRVAPAEALRYE